MTFATDVDDDIDDVFLETDEYAETVTYRRAAQGDTATIKVVAEEQVFAILDDKANKKFHIGATLFEQVAPDGFGPAKLL